MSHLNLPKFYLREFVAGLTTFMTMAHAFVIIPSLLTLVGVSFPVGLVTTVVITLFGSLTLGVIANYPIAVAPSITLVAYTVYNLGLYKKIPWVDVSTITTCVGLLLVFLNFIRVREKIFESIPLSLRIGVQAGLGLFLALIGLFNADILSSNHIGFLSFPSDLVLPHLLFFFSLALMSLFYSMRLFGGFLLAIFITWGMSHYFNLTTWEQGHLDLSYLKVKTLPFDLNYLLSFSGFEEFLSLALVVLFDTAAAVYAIALRGEYLIQKENGTTTIRGLRRIFFADSCATVLAGSIGGGIPSSYLSSITGIEAGGKTGWGAVLVGMLSLFTLFFLPFFSSVPLFATAAVFLIIGGGLFSSFKEMPWDDPSSWIPGVITFIGIPFTMSAATGVGMGYIAYVMLKIANRRWSEINIWTAVIAALFLLKFTFLPFS